MQSATSFLTLFEDTRAPDDEYTNAITRGDQETAQQMVNDAADELRPTYKHYQHHGYNDSPIFLRLDKQPKIKRPYHYEFGALGTWFGKPGEYSASHQGYGPNKINAFIFIKNPALGGARAFNSPKDIAELIVDFMDGWGPKILFKDNGFSHGFEPSMSILQTPPNTVRRWSKEEVIKAVNLAQRAKKEYIYSINAKQPGDYSYLGGDVFENITLGNISMFYTYSPAVSAKMWAEKFNSVEDYKDFIVDQIKKRWRFDITNPKQVKKVRSSQNENPTEKRKDDPAQQIDWLEIRMQRLSRAKTVEEAFLATQDIAGNVEVRARFTDWLEARGHDGWIVNSHEAEVAVFNPHHIKSSDFATYDKNLIPLSKRFDLTNPDYRR
jgi:hypothetical protein